MNFSESSQSSPTEKLTDILFEIQRNCNEGQWFLSAERLAELLHLNKEDYFRKFYAWRTNRIKFHATKGFHESDGHLLVEFLSFILSLPDVESDFVHAGVFFPEKSLDNLCAMYRTIVTNTLDRHSLDKELMMLLATSTLDYDDAVDSYLADKFDLNYFENRAILEFLDFYKVHTEYGAEKILRTYLDSMIPTKVLNFQQLTKEFRDRTYYELFGSFREPKKKKKKPGSKKSKTSKSSRFYSTEDAESEKENQKYLGLLQFFDLGVEATISDLRNKYKEMIKKHHPDVNKKGLEMTQKIIGKYNSLLQMMKERGR